MKSDTGSSKKTRGLGGFSKIKPEPVITISWNTVALMLLQESEESVTNGLLLSQVIGRFADAPNHFKNKFGIGCSILYENIDGITLVFQDGSSKQLDI
jgi:hypothetical protein